MELSKPCEARQRQGRLLSCGSGPHLAFKVFVALACRRSLCLQMTAGSVSEGMPGSAAGIETWESSRLENLRDDTIASQPDPLVVLFATRQAKNECILRIEADRVANSREHPKL